MELRYPVIHTVLVGNREIEIRIMRVYDLGRRRDRRCHADRIVWNDTTGAGCFAFLASRGIVKVAPGVVGAIGLFRDFCAITPFAVQSGGTSSGLSGAP